MSDFLFWQFRISTAYLFLFAVFFLPHRYGKRGTAAICLTGYMITGMLDYSCFMMAGEMHVPLAITLAEIILVQAVPLIISDYRDFRALFVGITASAYVLAGNIFATTIYLWCYDAFASMMVESVTNLLLLWYFVNRVRRDFLEILSQKDMIWGRLCLIPALFYAVIYSFCTWPADVMEYPRNLLGAYLVLALLVTAYTMIIKMAVRLHEDRVLQENLEYLEAYAGRLKYEADILQEKELEAAMLRHDTRHRIILIQTYLDEGNTEKIRELLQEADENIQKACKVRYCENISVNGVIEHAAKEAKKKEVALKIQAEIPQKLPVNEFEFATVISNLLENAVSAAGRVEKKEERAAWITSKHVKGQLVLEIGNTFLEAPEISRKTGLPSSRRGKLHGFGMQSVRAFAIKNNALFDYGVEEDHFLARLLISCPR